MAAEECDLSGQVSSIRNWLTDRKAGSYFDVEVYTGTGCTGLTRTLRSGNVDFNLAGTEFENRITSVRFLPR